ncbi:metal ABC transporter ATP-binding protein [Weissella soli]|uniref:metal ABC transporter ATP-binding protein n=1 Tax=Weissella soli TaxID=155866 RepID=UPI0011BBEE10|nr:ATP-binding cassette domain-containing protein [Weissella soli]QEA34427.1 ATP-binding cassette domain-containing protein [Weissella soli]
MKVVTGENVGIQFDNRWLYRQINFAVNKQRILAIVGDNGVGKTTLLRAILGVQTLTEGTIKYSDDHQVIAYVPQYRPDMQAFPIKISEYISLSFDSGLLPWKQPREKKLLAHIIEDTNLRQLANSRIDTASGGEKQRSYLAQALVKQPNILILDEATANLDNSAKYEFMEVVKHYQNHHELTILMVSHDLDIITRYADDYLLLSKEGGEQGFVADLDITRLQEGSQNHA